MRVEALRVGTPNVQYGTLDRLSIRPSYEAGHAQCIGLVGVARQVDVPLDQWRAFDVERPFNGTWRAAGAAGGGVLGVHMQVEEMLETDARRRFRNVRR